MRDLKSTKGRTRKVLVVPCGSSSVGRSAVSVGRVCTREADTCGGVCRRRVSHRCQTLGRRLLGLAAGIRSGPPATRCRRERQPFDAKMPTRRWPPEQRRMRRLSPTCNLTILKNLRRHESGAKASVRRVWIVEVPVDMWRLGLPCSHTKDRREPVGEWLFVFPLCGFSLSLFCNRREPVPQTGRYVG